LPPYLGRTTRTAARANRHSCFGALLDPLIDVDAPVAEVFPDSKPRWTLPAVSPRVERLDRDGEVLGEFLGGDERFEMLHAPIMRSNPVSRVLSRCHLPCSPPVRACFCNSSIWSVPLAQIRCDRATDTLLTGLLTLC
jgi:hypothetical protein